jgi:hypothetical protein
MALLAGGLRRRNAGHGGDKRLMICEELKLPTLEQETKMADGGEGGQQLPVEGRVLDLCWRQLLGEKCQWFPTISYLLLQHSSHV